MKLFWIVRKSLKFLIFLSILSIITTSLLLARTFKWLNKFNEEDIMIAVLTSPETFSRAKACHNTWANRTSCDVKYFLGNYSTKTQSKTDLRALLSQLSTSHPFLDKPLLDPPESSIVLLDTPEKSTHFITAKTIRTWYWMAKQKQKYKWFVKVDDDTFLSTSALLRQLNTQLYHVDPLEQLVFAGRFIQPADSEASVMVSGGAGYILSQKFATKLVETIELNNCSLVPRQIEEDLGEDVLLNQCAIYLGVDVVNIKGLHPHLPRSIDNWRGWDRTKRIYFEEDPISLHYAKGVEMYEIDFIAHQIN